MEITMHKRKPGRPKKQIAPKLPATHKRIYKSVGLEKEIYEKLDVIRNKYSEQFGFSMSYSQAIAYLCKDIK